MLKLLGSKAISSLNRYLNEMVNTKNTDFVSKGLVIPLPKPSKPKLIKILDPLFF